jgi:hypothetical protein
MGAAKRALFERCPLCHKGVVGIAMRAISGELSFGVAPCPNCGAIFAPDGDGSFRLGFCNPRRLAVARGLDSSGDACVECTPFAGCLIDRTLSKTEWDVLGQGKAMEPWVAFIDEGRRSFGEGPFAPMIGDEETSVGESPESGFMHLVDDEVVHHESTVRLGEAKFADAWHDEAQLLLTSRRILVVHQAVMFDIHLADIEKVELSFPGFVITARKVPYSLYCLPAPGDPIYHVILGALKRIH